jgi:hypothetical protein
MSFDGRPGPVPLTGASAKYNNDARCLMRTTHALVLVSAIVASGFGLSAIRAQQSSSAGTVVVYKAPT